MANLTFTKERNGWAADTTVSGNFNLHIEGGGSMVSVYQKTAGDKYCLVRGTSQTGDCYDYDFGGYIYPKGIKVVCEKEPNVGIITEAQ